MKIRQPLPSILWPALSSLAILYLISGVILIPAAAAQVQAEPGPDILVFTNGDQLSGKLEREVGDSVVFKSDSVGEITISMSKVKQLRSNGSFVVLKKGEKATRTSKGAGGLQYEGGAVVVNEDGGRSESVPVKDLAYLMDAAAYDKEVTDNPTPWQGWDGAISGGVSLIRATDYGENFNLGLGLIRAIPSVSFLPPRTRSTINVLETYGKLTSPIIPQTTPPSPAATTKTSIFHADAEHDKYLSSRFYALAATSFDHNYSQGLNFQQIYGGGVGYTIIKTPVQQFDAKVDVHYERQNFVPPNPSDNLIGSIFGEMYTRNLPHKIVFDEKGTFIPSWNKSSDYSAIVAAGLVMPAYKRLSVDINLLDNYLNNPAAGYNKNSFQFITGFSYTLK